MKKILNIAALCVALSPLASFAGGEQLATGVKAYMYPGPLPNLIHASFSISRSNLIFSTSRLGYPSPTGSRTVIPSDLAIASDVHSFDMCVSSNLFLHQGVINPPSAMNTQGDRLYCPVIFVGVGGQISQDNIDYFVICGLASYGNSASLAGLGQSITRVGVYKGPDGILLTSDDIYDIVGDGSVLFDAIIFIGARVGAEVAAQSDLNSLDAAIEQLPGGNMPVTFLYRYHLASGQIVSNSFSARVWPSDGIPFIRSGFQTFGTPQNGLFYSVVGLKGQSPVRMETATQDVELGTWSAVNTSNPFAREGNSVFAPPVPLRTEPKRFYRLLPPEAGARPYIARTKSPYRLVTAKDLPRPNHGTEVDQDRPF